jgi:hypothetical protein
MVGTSNLDSCCMAIDIMILDIISVYKLIILVSPIIYQYSTLIVYRNSIPIIQEGGFWFNIYHNYGKSQFLMGKLTINGHFP